MNVALLVLSVLATSAANHAPVYWSFPGADGETLRSAMSEVQGLLGPEHLISAEDRDQFIERVVFPKNLGCFDDSIRCADSERAVLSVLGLSARIEARHRREGDTFIVELKSMRAEGGSEQGFSGRGEDLKSAAASAFGAVVGKGTLVLKLEPADASIRVDGDPFGQGEGEYLLAAGRHTLLIEADGHKPMEQEITVPADSRLTVKIRLAVSDARVTLKVKPATASVFMDDEAWNTPTVERSFRPGDHLLRIEAPGFVPYTETVTLKSGVGHQLKLKLRPKDPPWRKLLTKPHPDVRTKRWSVRFDLRLGSIRDGTLDLPAGGPKTLMTQADAMGLSGLGLILSHDWNIVSVDLLGLSFENGYGLTSVRISERLQNESRTRGGQLETVERTKIRALWVGARYSRWRISPYFKTGPLLIMERLAGIDGQVEIEFDVSDTRLAMGSELGVKYRLTPQFYGGLGGHFDYWPDERASASVLIFAGYAFALDGILPSMEGLLP